jgi:hypothetical protein
MPPKKADKKDQQSPRSGKKERQSPKSNKKDQQSPRSGKKDSVVIHPTFDLDKILESPQPAVIYGSATKSSKVPKSNADAGAPDLSKYTEVDKSQWMTLPSNTYIRYIDTEGAWRPGGRVKSIKADTDGNAFVVGKYNMFLKKFTMWNIKFANVTKLYRMIEADKSTPKPATNPVGPPVTVVHSEAMGGAAHKPETTEDQILGQLGNKILFEDGDMLRHKVEALESEIQRMGDDQKNLLTLIKRLYNRLERAGIQ